MIFMWKREAARYCLVKCPCAMMMRMITGSMNRSEDFRRLRRTKRLTGCYARNMLNNQKRPDRVQAMNGKVYDYESLLYKAGETGGAYVIFPFDIRKEFGRGRVKVHATFDGEAYDGSIVNMGVKNDDGSICYIIGVRKDIRSRIGKQPGDSVRVTIRERE